MQFRLKEDLMKYHIFFNLLSKSIIECYIHIPQHDKKLLRKTSLKVMCHTITQAEQKREI